MRDVGLEYLINKTITNVWKDPADSMFTGCHDSRRIDFSDGTSVYVSGDCFGTVRVERVEDDE